MADLLAVTTRREPRAHLRIPASRSIVLQRGRRMRKTITGTGGMLLLQTLKDAGVEYLFTNPGSAETGIFAALAEDGDQRLVVGKHEGLVAAMADGYHRLSGKVERPGPARSQTVEAIARRLGEA